VEKSFFFFLLFSVFSLNLSLAAKKKKKKKEEDNAENQQQASNMKRGSAGHMHIMKVYFVSPSGLGLK
jgi:preprotein translocase subunit SecG